MARPQVLGLTGLVTPMPATVLVVSGLLGLDAPAGLVHPALVLGGLALAFVANVLAVARVAAGGGGGGLRREVTIPPPRRGPQPPGGRGRGAPGGGGTGERRVGG